MLGRIAVALEGGDVIDVVKALQGRNLWGQAAAPREMAVDLETIEPSPDWIDRYTGTGVRVAAYFGTQNDYYVMTDPEARTVRAAFDMAGGVEEVASLLSDIPFEVASFEPRYSEWITMRSHYGRIPGFGRYHFKHGWACAFQGDGHLRMVSRRWVDHGPWRVLRGSNDTTLVQFHDLDLDAEAAFAQARPAHRHMGISDEGGFLQSRYVYKEGLHGLYDAERRVMEVVVIGREVSPLEMRDACAARRDQKLGPEQPVDNVAFVFLDPREASAHLPRLWLYGLECWTIVDEVKTRLDTEEPPEGVDDPT
ncbi:hypothetical protein [Streptomyces milbemycinicus]|uniref:hypothetical protein n=1 Tax=Streptomyces milbemycinicus TaxID=476552 RepID=UPI00340977F8